MSANFIILADDYLAVEHKIEEIKKGFDLNVEAIIYNALEEGTYAIVDELSMGSFFDEVKLVIVHNANYLLSKTDQAFLELLKVMNNPNSSNVLIFVFMENIDLENEQYQKLKRFSSVIEVKTKNMNFEEYTLDAFQKLGFIVEPETIKLLTSYAENFSMLRGFIDQLECYKLEEKSITTQDVNQLISKPLDDNVYSLIEAVLIQDKRHILKIYQDMKFRMMQSTNLVSLLINKFQEIYNVNVLVSSGMSQASIADVFHVTSGRAYYMIKNVKEHSLSEIQFHLELLNTLDYQIKTGKIDANTGLELYFLR